MIQVRLSKPEFEWIIGSLEYLNDFTPPERATVNSIREQIEPDFRWEPISRPPVADAVIESFIDVVESAIGNANMMLKSYGLIGEAKDSLVRARQGLAETMIMLGATERWVRDEIES